MVKTPVRSIVGAIAGVAIQWSNAAFAARIRARDAVSARTGYSLPVVEYAFDRLFGSLRRDQIEAVIADELGSLDVLDGFAKRSGRPRAHALPVGRVCIVSSRTTIGVAIVPAIFALCAKCEVLVKDREDALVAAFFETLAQAHPELAAAATAQPWTGDADAPSLGTFDAVVVFGSDATLATIAATVASPTRLIGFGSKGSAGYVTREALQSETEAQRIARGAARDLVLYDSEGCLSLHALFVEHGSAVSPQRFAEMLADAIRDVTVEFPSAPADTTTAGLAMARDLAAFRTGRQHIYSEPTAAYLAVLDPPIEEPPLFLPRTIGIHSVEHPAKVAEYFKRHSISLEALAVSHRRPDLLELAERLHAARIAPFGTLQAPPLGVFHGGRPRIAEFVRWIVDET
jgi:Acyl-CoA reductase (LuxC)